MNIKIPKNFFGEEIELTVFISEEQLKKKKPLSAMENILRILVFLMYSQNNSLIEGII